MHLDSTRHRVEDVVIEPAGLEGILTLPRGAGAVVLFAHGSGSSRFSPRNRQVAEALHASGLATLLFDLLMPQETQDRANVFDIDLLARRLVLATEWLTRQPAVRVLPIGYFGASTGAAAALVAAAQRRDIRAVVSRGGRPDMAGASLARVRAPTLLIVGAEDREVLALNRDAFRQLICEKRLATVPGATHLFEEPGALDAVIEIAARWFADHLLSPRGRQSTPGRDG